MSLDPRALSLVEGELRWRRELVAEEVANAYRRASLAGADMVGFGRAVEAAMAQSEGDDPFRFDRAIGKVCLVETDQVVNAQLLELRDDALTRIRTKVVELASTLGSEAAGWIQVVSACLVASEEKTALQIIQAAPTSPGPLPHGELVRGVALIDQRRFDATAPIFERFGRDVRVSPRQRALHLSTAARVQLSHGRADRALAVFDEAMSVLADVPEVLATKPDVWRWMGFTHRAESEYKEIIRAFPDHSTAYVRMGEGAVARKRFDLADSWYRRAQQTALDGDSGLMESAALRLQRHLSTIDDASSSLTKEQSMSDIEAAISLVEAIEPTLVWDVHARLCDIALSETAAAPPGTSRRAVSLDFATSAARKLTELEPEWPLGYVRLGEARLLAGDADEARTCFEQAMTVNQFSVGDIEHAVGEAYSRYADAVGEPSGEWRVTALEWLERAVEQCDAANRDLYRASVLSMELKIDPTDRKVLADTHAALAAEPDSAELFNALIDHSMNDSDHESRQEALSDLLVIVSPTFRSLVVNELANAHFEIGDYEAALGAYQEAVDWCPDDPTLLGNLARVQQELGRWEDARTTIDRAHDVAEDDAAYADALAALDNARGNASFSAEVYEDAAASYESAISRAPTEAVYHRNLAGALVQLPSSDVAHRVRSLERAILALEQSMRLEPEEDQTARITTYRQLVDYSKTYGLVAIDWEPLSKPLAIECSTALLPLIVDESLQLLPDVTAQIDRARSWIRNTYGVVLPAIRFREDASLPAGDFTVLLFDDLMERAHIDPLQGLALGDVAPEASSVRLFDGRRGTLRPASELASGQDSTNPIVIALDTIVQAVLLDLPLFFGVQETAALLAELGSEQLERDLPAQLGDSSKLVSLNMVLNGLLAENVPIIALADITVLVDERTSSGFDTVSTIEAARSLPSVRPQLPGREAGREYVLLAPAATKVFLDSIVEGPEPVASLPIADASGLDRGAAALDLTDAQCVVVVEPRIRPFVREFLRLRNYRNPVLASREVDDLPSWRASHTTLREWRLLEVEAAP